MTAFAESAVNQVVSKRMVKKQQCDGLSPARTTHCRSGRGVREPTLGDLRSLVSGNAKRTGDGNSRRPHSPRFEMLSQLSNSWGEPWSAYRES